MLKKSATMLRLRQSTPGSCLSPRAEIQTFLERVQAWVTKWQRICCCRTLAETLAGNLPSRVRRKVVHGLVALQTLCYTTA